MTLGWILVGRAEALVQVITFKRPDGWRHLGRHQDRPACAGGATPMGRQASFCAQGSGDKGAALFPQWVGGLGWRVACEGQDFLDGGRAGKKMAA